MLQKIDDTQCVYCKRSSLYLITTKKRLDDGTVFDMEYVHCSDCNHEYTSKDEILKNDSSVQLARKETCPIVYVDMDDVLCHFTRRFEQKLLANPKIQYPQCEYGFFASLDPISGASDAMNRFQKLTEAKKYNVYILTSPSTKNPLSYTEKRIWVENNIGDFWLERLIISPNKSLLKGDVLIDNNVSGKGQEDFEGKLIHFGNTEYPTWERVMRYFSNK